VLLTEVTVTGTALTVIVPELPDFVASSVDVAVTIAVPVALDE